MGTINQTPEHNTKNHNFSQFSSQLKKLGAGVALASALLIGNPNSAQAQTVEKKPIQTEQIEKQKAPDMIKFSKENFSKYFTPEEKLYFDHIFFIIANTEQHIQDVANLYLQKHGEQFKDEKDKITFILMTLELINGETKFTEAHEIQDDLDWRMVAANDVVQDMTKYFKEENAKAKEENAKAKEENAKAKEENAKAKEENTKARGKWEETKANLEAIKAKNKITKEKLKESLQGLERVLSEVSVEVVKTNQQAQEVVRYYENFCKENGYTPTEHAKKLIEALPKK